MFSDKTINCVECENDFTFPSASRNSSLPGDLPTNRVAVPNAVQLVGVSKVAAEVLGSAENDFVLHGQLTWFSFRFGTGKLVEAPLLMPI